MFKWLKSWAFRAPSATPQAEFAAVNYRGFDIYPEPLAEGGQYRVNGRITQLIAGEQQSMPLTRADLLPSAAQAAELMLDKAKRVIDEQGDRLFDGR